MFISVGVRFEANVEALNAVETVGNYSKHRRVPYLCYDEEKKRYRTVYVPAVSGESLAHAYQELLVHEALEAYGEKAPVCEDCRRSEFFKSMNKEYLKKKLKGGKIPEDPYLLENEVISNCLVEDVGGFLYAEKPPVKRSSAFQVSYALPIKSVAIYSVTEPQLHARHAQLKEVKAPRRGEASEQMIYYVETGTAIYGFLLNLDLDAIGRSALTSKIVIEDVEVKKRKEVAMKALVRMLSSRQFGAKLSRFFPMGDILSTAISITGHPFAVTSPIYSGYIMSTAERLKVLNTKFKEEAQLLVYDKGTEDLSELGRIDFAKTFDSPEEALTTAFEKVTK